MRILLVIMMAIVSMAQEIDIRELLIQKHPCMSMKKYDTKDVLKRQKKIIYSKRYKRLQYIKMLDRRLEECRKVSPFLAKIRFQELSKRDRYDLLKYVSHTSFLEYNNRPPSSGTGASK